MFVDTAKVSLKAGKGGDGAVSFRHEIYIPKGGPDGGNGGRGGNIIFLADKNTNTLLDFRYNPILTAENGKPGAGQRSAGRSGEDLIVKVPVGTQVYKIVNQRKGGETSDLSFAGDPELRRGLAALPRDGGRSERAPAKESVRSLSARSETVLIADLIYDGQKAIIAKGGAGGFGNAHFKSSTRQTPKIAEVGEPGEEFEAELELKLLADVGLVGLPNAGKSTFLSVVTNARPEIANYPFTTITPNLGVATIDNQDLLIADIPGLIEGASEGKGLGHAFLRHIDRTAVLLHLIDVYNEDAGEAYATIRAELAKYSDLKSRPEIVALTKTEGLDPDIIKMQKDSILAKNPQAKIFAISSQSHQGLTELLRALRQAINESKTTHQGMPSSSSVNAIGNPTIFSSNSPSSPTNSNITNDTISQSQITIASPPQSQEIPIIKLSDNQLKNAWTVTKQGNAYLVTGEKIEKFARRTDMSNYASVNRLRDIMKKLGIRAELTTQGAKPDSIIRIADKEFPLVEQYE
ncbi:GTPase ObgE [Candidatus Saccharibacteria bacterium]|nr:GTPase ObgE [Candidatus Saccharibacteria bacterium]